MNEINKQVILYIVNYLGLGTSKLGEEQSTFHDIKN